MTKELPIDKWIKEAEKLGTEEAVEPEKKRYSDKLVAWLDILGMRNKIRSSDDPEEVFNIMESLLGYVQNLCDNLSAEGRLNYLQISDGFIISAELSCINEVLEILCRIQWQVLVYTKMLLRGALTVGKISMTEDARLILGPAFIDAFSLESENAIYPRIILATQVHSLLAGEENKRTYIRSDIDGISYLDFIHFIIKTERKSLKEVKHLLETQGVLLRLKTEYEANGTSNIRVAQKLGWVISLLNDHKISTTS